MKKLLSLVCCSLFLFTSCGSTSYFESVSEDESSIDSEASNDSESENDGSNDENSDDKSSASVISSGTIFVQVAGSVKYPGVYELSTDSRVFEAIEAAGGLLDSADDSDINQAEALTDGEKIYVYSVAQKQELLIQEEASEAAEEDDGLVNINTADAETLKTLPGIGDSKANLIISYREANGDFQSIEDIMNVSGIGEGIYAQIQAYIKV